ncbi:PREDICTED: forkhead box protein C1-like [Priapulus caudatus]|uniref:Forkhead box protein C1-like n=1 Tax=Priapulus caudatus TaxID=37621 RepID=A0ABM1ERC2_PRICU
MTLFSIEGLMAERHQKPRDHVPPYSSCSMQFYHGQVDNHQLPAENQESRLLAVTDETTTSDSDSEPTQPTTSAKPSAADDEKKESAVRSPKKPNYSYIALISKAILSAANKKMLLSEIYQFIMDSHPFFRNEDRYWRNSIRHNLSLNECFIKAGRSENGKGNYWAIHPANVGDFGKGDFRRRRARRRARKSQLLSELSQRYRVATPPYYPMQYCPLSPPLPFAAPSPSTPPSLVATSHGFFPSVASSQASFTHASFSSAAAAVSSHAAPLQTSMLLSSAALSSYPVHGFLRSHTPAAPLSTPSLTNSSLLAPAGFTPPSPMSAPPAFPPHPSFQQWTDRNYGLTSLLSRMPPVHKLPMY